VDLESITAFPACRPIALSKNPGVRSIGVGETSRRIIAKAILSVVGGDVQEAAGFYITALCRISGWNCGWIHSVRESFEDDEMEAVVLVDTSNAFNLLNRDVALQNIRHF